ncbi:methylmalonyl-CoA mutase subunit beta [Polaribacter sargassicola]|uniref:methylmalonyl-CoA mutase subunit beta n=1 Tax=Polaribacter sargassicola TaxID=2836891 RepID=UPI001F240C78|nr:methylmalonyl-CoA mutase subunit beta [Polaribacter sp. DS7-9]MCG1037404.1 methylmalonyl-CoA mutase subunit beta [Polaribacter sp. DS7-9]
MSTSLFDEFKKTSPSAWKQKIQVDLNGADYNNTLLWKSPEGIVVKPFYTSEDRTNQKIKTPEQGFNTCQSIFVGDEKIANLLAIEALKNGVNSIQFIANNTFDYKKLLININIKEVYFYFQFKFIDSHFQVQLSKFINSEKTYFQTDIIGNLAETGNWYSNLQSDFNALNNIQKSTTNCISVSGDLYQNSGATITQQLAYSLAHANEYLNKFGADVAKKIHFSFSVGNNYFFEIAKLRAFRTLWATLITEYSVDNLEAHLFVKPSLRNKTLYNSNLNIVKTTSECMSAILGGANTICNISYDTIYKKSNKFGERIARNQLLILQQESLLNKAQDFADGSYYIESITQQLAENALLVFKQIEKNGGFLHQLKTGNIYRKIKENAIKEETSYLEENPDLLLHKDELMQEKLELYPFLKQRNIKTLIQPIHLNRTSESLEKEYLNSETNLNSF